MIFLPPTKEKSKFIWVLARFFLASENYEKIGVICPKSYLLDNPELDGKRWENDFFSKLINSYELFPLRWIPKKNIFLINDVNSENEESVNLRIATERIPELESELSEVIESIGKDKIDYFVSWFNCPSLSFIADKYNIRIIFNELGPLRYPNYKSVFYFDFKGVNGACSVLEVYDTFKNEFNKIGGKIFSLEEIRNFFEPFFKISYGQDNEPRFRIGIAMQCEDDSNLYAYSNGWTNLSLLDDLRHCYGNENVLVRFHPLGQKYKLSSPIDHSKSVRDFLSLIRELVTINSSVAAEAILLNKKVRIMGASPLTFITEENDFGEKLLKINYFFLYYLVPYPLLFNDAYYNWRLLSPTFENILRVNLYFLTGDQKYLNEAENLGLSFKFNMLKLFNQYKKESIISSINQIIEEYSESVRNEQEKK